MKLLTKTLIIDLMKIIKFAEKESKKFGLKTEVIPSQIEFTERFWRRCR